MTLYIRQLHKLVEEDRGSARPTTLTLRQRFLDWYDNLPEISRERAYSMVEMERALQTQGRYLSPILLGEGWQRKRKWSSQRQYLRYWVPPEANH